MKHKKIRYILLLLVIVVLLCVLFPPTRSYMVMKLYSSLENTKSVMDDNNFKIKVPTDEGWYPFTITFNSTNFGNWSQTGATMSIMYNFAEFKMNSLASEIFNPQSDKHSSFYGAYALEQDEGNFGYKNENIDISEIILTFKYDYQYLVLKDLGYKNSIFEVESVDITENVNYLDIDGWTKIDATMQTNAMTHNYNERYTSYIQYGKPTIKVSEDFPTIQMHGRLYIRVFEEYNSTIIVYVMSPSRDTITECDENILSRIIIQSKD